MIEVTFTLQEEDGTKKKFRLKEGQYIYIGRSSTQCQVVTTDSLCSNKHCKIYIKNGKIFVQDSGSKNGINVNDYRILEQRIFLEDKVTIGNAKINIIEDKLTDREFRKISKLHAKPGESLAISKSNKKSAETNPSQIFIENNNKKHGLKGRKQIQSDNISDRENQMENSRKKLNFLVTISSLIDYTSTILLFIFLIIVSDFFLEPIFLPLSKSPIDLEEIFSTNMPYYLVAIIFSTIIYHRLNIRRKSGSLGEKITGLAENF